MNIRHLFAEAMAGLSLLAAVADASAQPMALVPRPAEGSGCTVQVPSAMLQNAGPDTRYVVRWDGPCVGGSARGLGTLSVEGVSGTSQWRTDLRQTVMAGLPFGYERASSMLNSTPLRVIANVRFIHDGAALAFTEGWGLSLQGIEVGAPVVKVPEAGPIATVTGQFISNGFKTLMLMQANCRLHKSLPVCSGRDNSEFFALVELDDTQPGPARFSTRRTMPCADSQDIGSCAPLVKQWGAPMAAEIIRSIQRAKPDVESLLQRVSAPVSAVAAPAALVAVGTPGATPQPVPPATTAAVPGPGLIPGWVTVKTRAGCEMQAPSNWANFRRVDSPVTTSWEWDGSCVGGLTQGVGTAKWSMSAADRTWDISWRYAFHAGRPFGYFTESSRIQLRSGELLQAEWAGVVIGDEVARWTEGWGLEVKGVPVGVTSLAPLADAPVTPTVSQRLVVGSRTLAAVRTSCIGMSSYEPGCSGGAQEIYFLTELAPGESIASAVGGRRTRFVCPSPRDLNACAPLIQQTSAPLRAEIAALVERGRPSVASAAASMNAALRTTASAGPAGGAAVELERLSVGALFSAADEAAAKGDKTSARAALRALIRRFPDHPLAATAARQLAALQ